MSAEKSMLTHCGSQGEGPRPRSRAWCAGRGLSLAPKTVPPSLPPPHHAPLRMPPIEREENVLSGAFITNNCYINLLLYTYIYIRRIRCAGRATLPSLAEGVTCPYKDNRKWFVIFSLTDMI